MTAIGDWLGEHWDHDKHAIEHAASDVAGWFTPHRQTPAARPVSITTTTTEESTMSLSADLHGIIDVIDNVGEDAVAKLASVARNPETTQVFGVLATLAETAGIPAGVIADIGKGLSALAGLYAPQPAPDAAAPAPVAQ